jgi:hypothetical protein
MVEIGLPLGEQVARAMRAPVLSNSTLGPSNDPGWKGEAQLWLYILKEAELVSDALRALGRRGWRGSVQVCAVKPGAWATRSHLLARYSLLCWKQVGCRRVSQQLWVIPR